MPRKRGSLADWIADAALPIVVIDQRRRVRVFNRGAATLTGVAPGDLLGRRCEFAGDVPLEGPTAVLDACAIAASAFVGEPQTVSVTLPTNDSSTVDRLALLIPLEPEDDDGQLLVVFTQAEVASLAVAKELVSHAAVRNAAAKLQKKHGLLRLIATSPTMAKVLRQVRGAADSQLSAWIVGQRGTGRTHLARTIASVARYPVDSIATIDGRALDEKSFTAFLDSVFHSQRESPRCLLCEDVDAWQHEQHTLLAEKLRSIESQPRLIGTSVDERPPAVLADYMGDIEIRIPRLRDRPEDIRLLAQMFLEQAVAKLSATEASQHPHSFADSSQRVLESYSWPGEVGELARTVQAAVKRCQTDQVTIENLPSSLRLGIEADAFVPPQPIRGLEDVLREAERSHLSTALNAVGGDKAKAAKLLGISRPKLYRRLEQLDLPSDTE